MSDQPWALALRLLSELIASVAICIGLVAVFLP